jgi:hypothetical protein
MTAALAPNRTGETAAAHIAELLLAAVQAVRSDDYASAKSAVREAQRRINREMYRSGRNWLAARPSTMAPADSEPRPAVT